MNNKSDFDNKLVAKVSDFIKKHMEKTRVPSMTADQCADILAQNKILPNNVGLKPGINFRQMLRDGRDKKINLIKGAYQSSPGKRWVINRDYGDE